MYYVVFGLSDLCSITVVKLNVKLSRTILRYGDDLNLMHCHSFRH